MKYIHVIYTKDIDIEPEKDLLDREREEQKEPKPSPSFSFFLFFLDLELNPLSLARYESTHLLLVAKEVGMQSPLLYVSLPLELHVPTHPVHVCVGVREKSAKEAPYVSIPDTIIYIYKRTKM